MQWVVYPFVVVAACVVYWVMRSMRGSLVRAEQALHAEVAANASLVAIQARWQALVDSIDQSFVLIDCDAVILAFNQLAAHDARSIFGVEMRNGDSIYDFVAAEDRKDFTDHFMLALQGRRASVTKRFPDRSGESHWILYNYSPVYLDSGDLIGISFNAIDITEDKRREELLGRQNEYLSNLHQVTLDMLANQNTRDVLNNVVQFATVLVNARHGYIFLPEGDYIVLCAATREFRHNIGRCELQPGSGVLGRVWQTMETVVVTEHNEWGFLDGGYDNEPIHTIVGIPIRIGTRMIGVLEVARTAESRRFAGEELQILHRFAEMAAMVLNNSQLYSAAKHEALERRQVEMALRESNDRLNIQLTHVARLQDELREQSLHDPLTGLYNRRYLAETLTREIARIEREGESLSVIMADIDHFKYINDSYGHQVGDLFLREIADLMTKNARTSDIICRYGGEEFLMVLPGASMDDAERRANEIRQKCADLVIHHYGQSLSVTMSFGVATYPIHSASIEHVIINADKALYQSKHSGRNRVTLYQSSDRSG